MYKCARKYAISVMYFIKSNFVAYSRWNQIVSDGVRTELNYEAAMGWQYYSKSTLFYQSIILKIYL